MYYTVTVKTFLVIVNRVLHGKIALTRTYALTEKPCGGGMVFRTSSLIFLFPIKRSLATFMWFLKAWNDVFKQLVVAIV